MHPKAKHMADCLAGSIVELAQRWRQRQSDEPWTDYEGWFKEHCAQFEVEFVKACGIDRELAFGCEFAVDGRRYALTVKAKAQKCMLYELDRTIRRSRPALNEIR